MKFGDCFSNLLGIECAKFCLNSFRFDISILQCLGVYFYSGHNVHQMLRYCDFIFELQLVRDLLQCPSSALKQ